jgi:hypothetical protein
VIFHQGPIVGSSGNNNFDCCLEIPLWGVTSAPQRFRLSEREWQTVVYGAAEILFAPYVAFGSLNGCVSEKKLDLFQLAAGGVAQSSARPPQVVRGERLYVPLGPRTPLLCTKQRFL